MGWASIWLRHKLPLGPSILSCQLRRGADQVALIGNRIIGAHVVLQADRPRAAVLLHPIFMADAGSLLFATLAERLGPDRLLDRRAVRPLRMHHHVSKAGGNAQGQDLSLIHISEPTRRTPISYA